MRSILDSQNDETAEAEKQRIGFPSEQISREVVQNCASAGPGRGSYRQGQEQRSRTRHGRGLAALATSQRESMRRFETQLSSRMSRSAWIQLLLIVVALGTGVGVLYVVRSATRSLKVVASRLAESAGCVAEAADQVSAASESLAQGASEQTASLQETSPSTDEITAMTHRNADHLRPAAAVIVDVDRSAQETRRTLTQMIAPMKEINDSSGKISKIIRLIEEIAFQTNILALNAAVEAARAGEAGLGFAVVADEVGNLAKRCTQAAEDTGALTLTQVSTAVQGLMEHAGKVKTLVDEVEEGSAEQALGIEQIAKALSSIQQVTQQAAATAEESAAATQNLRSQSRAMDEVANMLQLLVEGSKAAWRKPA